jgi:hypothetical protein
MELEKEFTCITDVDDDDDDDDNDNDDDVDIIDVPLWRGDEKGMVDIGGLEVVTLPEGEKQEKGEKGEKCEKENNNSKLKMEEKKGLEIELLITKSTCDEVIFKKHFVEIIDKGTRRCVMNGVVERYEFEGRVWDPDIVLVFEDGRRFCNENFGYMFRYYI